MKVVLIAAHNRTLVIGRNGAVPWHLPEDLRRFKALTTGHTILMGRRTYDSIGRTLPGRRNIIISRQQLLLPDAEIFPGIPEALSSCTSDEILYVIGGGEIFRQMLAMADEMKLTVVENTEQGDTTFPEYDHLIGPVFRLTAEEKREGFTFKDYRRNSS